jgi:hypothetical protein
MIEIQSRTDKYHSMAWNAAEYLALFLIVLMHEFGHALACRSVGGRADRILLWPLGGVAFVDPPQRPGAVLWSIVAGPLVNVILVPITLVVAYQFDVLRVHGDFTSLQRFIQAIFAINLGLLIFNLLPIYPLTVGRFCGCVSGFLWAARKPDDRQRDQLAAPRWGVVVHCKRDVWLTLIAGLRDAAADRLPASRHRRWHRRPATGLACPNCGNAPPASPNWTCGCGNAVDVQPRKAAAPTAERLSAPRPSAAAARWVRGSRRLPTRHHPPELIDPPICPFRGRPPKG